MSLNLLRRLLSKTRLFHSRSSMTIATQVLHCDVSSISFEESSEYPQITSPDTLDALSAAASQILAQQTVAFPTETVYGLGALALDSLAASRIFSTKGRPPDNPLIVHVSSTAMLHSLLPKDYILPKHYQILIKRFWPGALTLLFPSDSAMIPSVITANHPTVAIRMPSHPVARALIAITNAPIAAPSANSSGRPSPTRAEHVLHDLRGKIGLILDGGSCEVGLESTVVDGLNDDGNLRVIRPGGITAEEIERVIHDELATSEHIPKVLVHRRDYRDDIIESAPTTPGMKYRHYSPSVPVTLLLTSPPLDGNEATPANSFFLSLLRPGPKPTKIGIMTLSDSRLAKFQLPAEGFQWHLYPLGPVSDPSITAHRLFDGLISLDKEGVDAILIEEVKEINEGLAVMNRVRKAAGELKWISVP